MTMECAGPNCMNGIPSYDNLGNMPDPERADLPIFKLTYYDEDQQVRPDDDSWEETGMFMTPVFCSQECQSEFVEEEL